jgi:EmrB/QacA subfamily drug resistance transporter
MEYKWKALGIVSLGTLMGSIDATVLIIAFPQIARDLAASLAEMVWVVMVYILMGTAFVLSFGRIADMKGRKRIYLAGFGIFIVGSALSGFSGTGFELVLARALQGIGGALLVANAFALLSDAFPAHERGRAFGFNAIVWSGGSIFGIVLGGLILTVTTWRWIFWINVPIGIAAVLAGLAVLRESVTPNPRDTFDLSAAVLFTFALVSLLVGVTEGILTAWTDVGAWGPMLLSLPLFLVFVVWEVRISSDPILPFSLFRNWIFSASLTVAILQGLGIFAMNFLLMVYFQGIRGISVLSASYLLIPLSLALATVGPLGGRLSDRNGARIVSTVGLVIQAGILVALAGLTPSTPLWQVALYEGIYGAGAGLFFPANTAAIMGAVPRARYGVASGAMMTFRNAAMSLSFAVALVALTIGLPAGTAAVLLGGSFTPSTLSSLHLTLGQLNVAFLHGMRVAYLASAAIVGASAVVSALRGRERRAGVDDLEGRRLGVRPPRVPISTSPPEPAQNS